MGKKYAIGVDFGTLSGRAVLVEVANGHEIATAVKDYTHGVMDKYLPDGITKLGSDWALQHPGDWLEVFADTIPAVINEAGVNAADVIGIGVDFTACTIMPVYKDGTPLCMTEKFKSNPHAWPKLWKHHAAQEEANRLNEIALERGEKFVNRYGGKQSSEWAVAKVMQLVNEDPEIYDEMDRFIEATDWVTWQLTGVEKRQICTAGYKGVWHKREGYPSKNFFKSLHPKLENYVEDKLSSELLPLGSKAGEISETASKLTGLEHGTAVCVGNVDAHVSVPAVGITEPGKILLIMGTSTCDILLGTEEKVVPGMCGVVEDGAMPGYFAYEAGQSCVGDHFSWFVKNCVPPSYVNEAKERGIDIYKLLEEKAAKLKIGESGLLALDWWNGNRSVLVDVDLTGLIIGCTLSTKPEEIFRALVEATAYGQRMIIETFVNSGVPIYEVYACGGIASKNDFMMQIYADVLNKDIKIAASNQTPALGAAIFAAVAAGKERGGYESVYDAAKAMGKVKDKFFKPIKSNVEAYNKLYAEYSILHDFFGRGGNDVMKRLKKIKEDADNA